MSVINNIRKHSGWAVGFIGISITLFVLGDLFGNNTLFGGGNNQTLGEIDGKEINIQLIPGCNNHPVQLTSKDSFIVFVRIISAISFFSSLDKQYSSNDESLLSFSFLKISFH